MKKKALLWFTRDLRVQDNLLIDWAFKESYEVIGLAFEAKGSSSVHKEFYLHSAFELEAKFRDNKIPFFVVKGDAVQEIEKWVSVNKIDIVLTQDSFNTRDRRSLDQLIDKLGSGRIKTFFGQTLISKDKLPFEISKMPFVFTEFRKLIGKSDCIAKPVSSQMATLCGFAPIIPENVEWAKRPTSSNVTLFPFELKAGESGFFERMNEYYWQSQAIGEYKKTRNGMLLKNDSSKFSLGLGIGCVSVRSIYLELKNYESAHGASESTKWFFYELLWRDYFKFLALRIGDNLFALNGISKKNRTWARDMNGFNSWCEGETGADFIDANMIELKKTGWMSNRGRQNVASYLAKTMNIEWTLGAEYFENTLVDIDTESNWGNWLYVAGVGTDPRDRIFNYQRQAEMYDLDYSYRKTWLPIDRWNKKWSLVVSVEES